MRKVLLTGTSGFIGLAVERLLYTDKFGIEARFAKRNGKNKSDISLDLESDYNLSELLESWQPDTLLHLAWAGIPDFSEEQNQKNIQNSFRLIDQSLNLGVKRVILAGSCWQYGTVTGEISEDHPVINPSALGVCKNTLFQSARVLADSHSAELAEARIFYAYGPNQKPSSLLPYIVNNLIRGVKPEFKDPNGAFDFIYVDDVAKALLCLCQTEAAVDGIFNIGSGYATSVKQIANLVSQSLSQTTIFADLSSNSGFWGNNQKLSRLGWKVETSVAEGIESYLKHIKQQDKNYIA